jgi:hypothetical protein
MAITLTTGSTLSVAKTYAASLNFTTATNASPCALTVSGSTIVAGDYVEVNSGWGLLDKRLVRAGAGTSATSIVLEGIDTTDTTKYPAGAGAGSARKVTTWTQISQVKSISRQRRPAAVRRRHKPRSDQVTRQIPTVRGAVEMTVDVFDDPSLAWYADVMKADDARSPVRYDPGVPERLEDGRQRLLVADACADHGSERGPDDPDQPVVRV